MTLTAVTLASAWDIFSIRTLGEATLISVAAIIVGFVVSKIWPKHQSPQLFGALAATLLVGGLAYLGSAGAGLSLVILILFGAVLAIAGVMW